MRLTVNKKLPFILQWLRAVRKADLSVGATALAAVMASYAEENGRECRPGDKLLRARLKVKERALLNYRLELKDAGLIALASTHAPGRAAEWRLILPSQQVHSDAPVDGDRCTQMHLTVPSGASGRHQQVHLDDTPPPRDKPLKTFMSAKPPRDDVERLCAHLADRIAANGSKRPKIGTRWLDAARLMLDRDGRTEAQIRAAIDWCQDDEFWRSNILSMPKLREKYDQLRLNAARSKRGDIDWDEALALSRAADAAKRGELP